MSFSSHLALTPPAPLGWQPLVSGALGSQRGTLPTSGGSWAWPEPLAQPGDWGGLAACSHNFLELTLATSRLVCMPSEQATLLGSCPVAGVSHAGVNTVQNSVPWL